MGTVPVFLAMKTWIEYLKSGLARKAPEDRIAGGKSYAGIGENLRRHKPFFRRHWKKGALGAGFILLNALMAFPMPLVSRFVIDDVILGRQLSLLPWVLLLMAAIALFSRAMGLFQNWFFLRYSQDITLDIQKQVLDHSFSLPKSFFDKNQTGYLLARMTGDIGGVTWFLSGSLVGILTNILYFIGGIVLLFWLEWRLALAALAAVPVFLIVLRRFSDRMHALNHAGSEENARYMSGFQETLNSIPLVKAFAAEEKAVGKIMAGLRQVFRLSAERSVVGSVTGLALSSTPSLVNFCVFARSERTGSSRATGAWGLSLPSRPTWAASSARRSRSPRRACRCRTSGHRSSASRPFWMSCRRKTQGRVKRSKRSKATSSSGTSPSNTTRKTPYSARYPSASARANTSPSWGRAAWARRRF